MNTPEITAADVVAWLILERDRLQPECVDSFGLSINTRGHLPFTAQGYYSGGKDFEITHGASTDEATAALVALLDPREVAEQKRAEAAKLLAEAETLCPTALPDGFVRL
jgi:hypothetical protein